MDYFVFEYSIKNSLSSSYAAKELQKSIGTDEVILNAFLEKISLKFDNLSIAPMWIIYMKTKTKVLAV